MSLEASKLSLSTLSTIDGRSLGGSSGNVQLVSVSCTDVSSPFRCAAPPPSKVWSAGSVGNVGASSSSSCPALSSVSASEKQLCPPTPTDHWGTGNGGVREWFSARFADVALRRYALLLLENWRLVVAYATPFVLLPWPLALRQPVHEPRSIESCARRW